MIGAADRNTVCRAASTDPVTAAAVSAGRARMAAGLSSSSETRPPTAASASGESRAGSSNASRAFRIVPKTATPNEPPSDRKNCAEAVATPRSRCSTAFCTASSDTCMTIPTPRPSSAIEAAIAGRGVPACNWLRSSMPPAAQALPAIG